MATKVITQGPQYQIDASLSIKGPTLNSTMTVPTNGVRDVQVNGESIVNDRKQAKLQVGEGLEFTNKVLQLRPENIPKWIDVDITQPVVPRDALKYISHNAVTILVYESAVYRLAQCQDGYYYFVTTNPSTTLNQIVVNVDTGEYSITSAVPQSLQDHIDDTVVHITAAERENWNDKVSAKIEKMADVTPDDDQNYILHFYK